MNEFGSLSPGGRYVLALALALMLAVVLAAPALAEAPMDDQYGSPLSSGAAGEPEPSAGASATAAEGPASGAGTLAVLPATGGSLLVHAGIAAVSVTGGCMLLVRRLRSR